MMKPYDYVQAGKATEAAFKRALRWAGSQITARLFYTMMVLLALLALLDTSPFMRDNSDGPGWSVGTRSGMNIRTDNLSGCQYLEGKRGGLTPRLHSDGVHMGCRP